MLRVLSTYLFSAQPLDAAAIAASAAAGFGAIELYAVGGHFNFRSAEQARELGRWLEDSAMKLHSVHAPTERTTGHGREGGAPISIAEPDKLRRIEAMDEIKWALELAEQVPFRYLVQHLGTGRESSDPRYREAAFQSLEYLAVFAKQRAVTIALENTGGELGTPEALVDFLRETRLDGLRLCFDVGHARLGEGVAESFARMRSRVVTTHVHDNRGKFDDHLVPFEGTIDWAGALTVMCGIPDELPLLLEVKEPTAGVARAMVEKAAAAARRLEELAKGGKSVAGKE